MWRWADPCKDWATAEPYVADALRSLNEGYEPQDVLAMLIDGKVDLIVGERFAAVVERVVTPRMKSVHVWLAGGDLRELQESEPQFAEELREHGFKRISIVGRTGWGKALSGYSQNAILLSKEL